ncbi:hypothetical protein LDENG_00214060 [Lucifuga dentata]|nr:hypothetical protein LDENG_00214060 [Lucifuga dentata]
MLHISETDLLSEDVHSSQHFQCRLSPSHLHPSPPCHLFPRSPTESEGSRPPVLQLDLEQWYQKLMAAGRSSQLSPPPLPAKPLSGRRPVLQVFRSKLGDEAGQLFHQPKPGCGSPVQHGAATLGRNSTSKSPLLVAHSTGSLPRNLAATLQDIETKRQLALQQKGECRRCR